MNDIHSTIYYEQNTYIVSQRLGWVKFIFPYLEIFQKSIISIQVRHILSHKFCVYANKITFGIQEAELYSFIKQSMAVNLYQGCRGKTVLKKLRYFNICIFF